jgi:hypothetical protein
MLKKNLLVRVNIEKGKGEGGILNKTEEPKPEPLRVGDAEKVSTGKRLYKERQRRGGILKKTEEPRPEPLRVGDAEKLSTGKS